MSDSPMQGPEGVVRAFAGGLELTFDPARGLQTIGGIASTALFRDSSLASLMLGILVMVGPERFSLALQVEGRKGTAGDWGVISSAPTFEQGFEQLADYAAVAGWGRWKLLSLDRQKREMRLQITDSWEGHIQRALDIDWGPGLAAGKFADFATRVFGTHCRAELVESMARGNDADVFVVRPSDTSMEQELEAMLETEKATREDLARALRELREASAERSRALEERDKTVTELRAQIEVVERQQAAIRAMSTPIIQVWDGVLVVPVIGVVDGNRTADIMEKLLEELVRSKSRYAILDLTGVDTVDTQTAENFLRVIGAAQLLGARGLIAGINPLIAQTITALGVDLGRIAVYANLKEALKAAIKTMGQKAKG